MRPAHRRLLTGYLVLSIARDLSEVGRFGWELLSRHRLAKRRARLATDEWPRPNVPYFGEADVRNAPVEQVGGL